MSFLLNLAPFAPILLIGVLFGIGSHFAGRA